MVGVTVCFMYKSGNIFVTNFVQGTFFFTSSALTEMFYKIVSRVTVDLDNVLKIDEKAMVVSVEPCVSIGFLNRSRTLLGWMLILLFVVS